MHNLSWALLIIETIQNVSIVFLLMGGFCVAVGGWLALQSAIMADCSARTYWTENEVKMFRKWAKSAKKFFIAGLVFLPVSVLIPSTKTMYQVVGIETVVSVMETTAAKELGDQTLETVKDFLKSLRKENKW